MTGVAASLVERLGRHYVKPGRGGGIFVPEVGTNDWGATGSRCDAVYVGFSSTHGRILIGHEVKISRGDWLHELDQPGKADFWHDNSHAWYVVAPAAGIVRPEELPPGWGLLLPNTRSAVRFDPAVKAVVREDVTPSWLAIRSVMARADTLQHAAVHQAQADGAEIVLRQAVDHWTNKGHLAPVSSATVTSLLRQVVELAEVAASKRGPRVGRMTVAQLAQRIAERLDLDHNAYVADCDAIIAAVADHTQVVRAAKELRFDLQQRVFHAQSLIAELPPHLTALLGGDPEGLHDGDLSPDLTTVARL